jgi:predicted transcriptional regulator of viral defense system
MAASTDRALVATLSRASKAGLISVAEAAKALDLAPAAASIQLARLTRRGWLSRARRGLYVVLPLEATPGRSATTADPWLLAHQLFAPCYIGGWSAAEHWGLTEQLFRLTLVVTAANVRATNVGNLGHEFRLFRVPRSRLTDGIVMEWRGKERVAVSGMERTLVDCLRNPELCGGARHLAQLMQAYGESPKHNFAKLEAVAKHVGLGATWKRLGYFAEQLWPRETALLTEARKHITAGNSKLDPAVKGTGKLVTKWRLVVNRSEDDRAIIGPDMPDIWVKRSNSFDEARGADREFWLATSPEVRLAAVEELRQHWAQLKGISHEGLRRTVRVFQAPER